MPNCDPLIQIFFFFSRKVINIIIVKKRYTKYQKKKTLFLSKTFLLIIPKIQGRRAR